MIDRRAMLARKDDALLTGEGARYAAGPGSEPLPATPFDLLSQREREIARLVASGWSNKEIARELMISPCTVSSHLRQTFAKLGLNRRTELCMLWHRAQGLVAMSKC